MAALVKVDHTDRGLATRHVGAALAGGQFCTSKFALRQNLKDFPTTTTAVTTFRHHTTYTPVKHSYQHSCTRIHALTIALASALFGFLYCIPALNPPRTVGKRHVQALLFGHHSVTPSCPSLKTQPCTSTTGCQTPYPQASLRLPPARMRTETLEAVDRTVGELLEVTGK